MKCRPKSVAVLRCFRSGRAALHIASSSSVECISRPLGSLSSICLMCFSFCSVSRSCTIHRCPIHHQTLLLSDHYQSGPTSLTIVCRILHPSTRRWNTSNAKYSEAMVGTNCAILPASRSSTIVRRSVLTNVSGSIVLNLAGSRRSQFT